MSKKNKSRISNSSSKPKAASSLENKKKTKLSMAKSPRSASGFIQKALSALPSKQHTQRNLAELGLEGEKQIYGVLKQIFGVNAVFRNVYVRRPSGRLTEIDLLVVHQTGVYVVESKNYSGKVIGDGKMNEWVQQKGASSVRSFYSPVLQNKGHIDALRVACLNCLGIVPPMLSMLVFPDRCELQITNLPMGLRCCRLTQLPAVLSDVASKVRPTLYPSHIQALAALFHLSQRHMLPPKIQEQHMKDVASARAWAKK